MTSKLLHLPNETIYKIYEHIDPYDLVYFALSCKELHHLATKRGILTENRELLKKYGKLRFGSCSGDCFRLPYDQHPLDFLTKICNNRGLSLFPTELVLACCQRPLAHQFTSQEKTADLENIRQIQSTVLAMSDNSLCGHMNPGTSIDPEEWDHHVLVAILLLLLPNVRRIDFRGYGSCFMSKTSRVVYDFIWRIAREDTNLNIRRMPLSKLAEVNFDGNDTDQDETQALNTFFPLALIPSMRELTMTKIRNTSRHHLTHHLSLDPKKTKKKSSVELLEFLRSNLYRVDISQCLADIRSLRSFTYDHLPDPRETTPISSYSESDAFRHTITSLLKHHSSTLESLQLTTRCRYTNWRHHASRNGRSHIKKFCALKQLTIGIDILMPGHDDIPIFSGLDDKTLRYLPLVDILPASIEVVNLIWGCSPSLKVLDFILSKLDKFKETKLPRLRKITATSSDRTYLEWSARADEEAMKKMCKNVGLQLILE